MKRVLAFLLVCLMLLPLVSCKPEQPTKPNVETEDNKVHLIVLAGQSGARGKALVNDLSASNILITVLVFSYSTSPPFKPLQR